MPIKTAKRAYKKVQPIAICLMAALFYFYEFAQRVLPSSAGNHLMLHFNMTAQGLGLLASLFYYGYTPMQIPSGLLFDKFGPRLLMTLAMLCCGLVTMIFATTDNYTVALVTRFVVGFMSAFAFVGSLVLVARWLPSKFFAIGVGLVQLLGSVGAIVGERPIVILMHQYGWQETTMGLAYAGIALALLFWLVIRDNPEQEQHEIASEFRLSYLKDVIASRQNWAAAVYMFCVWAPISVFAVMWGSQFLEGLMKITLAHAAGAIAIVWVGNAIGGPIMGWLSDTYKTRKIPMVIAAGFGMIACGSLIFAHHISWGWLYVVLFILGFAPSIQSVAFGVINDVNPTERQGTAVGFGNMWIILSGMTILPLIGVYLDHTWSGHIVGGIHVYSLEHYRQALSVLILTNLTALLIALFWVKETHCESQY